MKMKMKNNFKFDQVLVTLILLLVNIYAQEIDIVKLMNMNMNNKILGEEIQKEFEMFKKTQAKIYINSQEEIYRMMIFAQNFKKIRQHNEQIAAANNNNTKPLGSSYNRNINQYRLSQNRFNIQSFSSNLNNNNFPQPRPNQMSLDQVYPSSPQIPANSIFSQDSFMNINKFPQKQLQLQTTKQQIYKKASKFLLELNKFADLTEIQFSKIYTMTYKLTDTIVEKIKNIDELTEEEKYIVNEQVRNIVEEEKRRKQSMDRSSQSESTSSISNTINSNVGGRQTLNQNIGFMQPSVNPDLSLQMSTPAFVSSSQPQQTQIAALKLTPQSQKNSNIIYPSGSFSRSRRFLQSIQKISIDWTRMSGNIRSQGLCGSCYAFTTADAIASINAIYYYRTFLPLSVKQILDCNTNNLSFGCDGGFLEGAYSYIQRYGLLPQFKYPYSLTRSTCPENIKGEHRILRFRRLPKSCPILIQELKKKPVAVGVAGARLQFYKEGVFDDCNLYVDHAVLLIGYQTGIGWKCKNSWGENWGMRGYFWLAEGNKCGICDNAVTVITQLENRSRY